MPAFALLAFGLLAGCAVAPAAEPTSPAPSAPGGHVQAVSGSRPSSGARDAMAKCHVGDSIPLSRVVAMGEIGSARDLVHYIPLTGREPQLLEDGPAWIIRVHGELPQPRSGEIWIDPTCVVTTSDAGYLATGPVRNAETGALVTPEAPVVPPDRALPSLAP